MPRNGSGTFTLVSGNPVVTGTTIESNWANTTLSDIATTLTDSLSRSGQGGMTAALRLADGSQSAPGVAFSNETGTGIYRAGTADARLAVTGSLVQKWTTSGAAITGALSATGDVGVGTATPVFGSGSGLEIERAGIATLRLENSAASNSFELYADSAANGINLRGRDSSPLVFWTANTEKARLDSSGNLGLGVTPSAWVGDKALQVNWGSISSGYEYSVNVSSVAYRDNTTWKYLASSQAPARYEQIGGAHKWFTAGTGTADNAISFTQAMTLTSGGDLGVGTSSPATKLQVVGGQVLLDNGQFYGIKSSGGSNNSVLNLDASNNLLIGAGGATATAQMWTGGTERARITSGGDLLVGTTSNTESSRIFVSYPLAQSGGAAAIGTEVDDTTTLRAIAFRNPNGLVGTITTSGSATSYNTSSDYRLKDNQQPLTGSGAFIDALQPKTWDWKADGSRGVGFIAHEVQAVSPGSVVGTKDAVDADGKPVMQAMEYGSAEFIANIVAELQSLRARVAALESQP
jgi:hypothetical protein